MNDRLKNMTRLMALLMLFSLMQVFALAEGDLLKEIQPFVIPQE